MVLGEVIPQLGLDGAWRDGVDSDLPIGQIQREVAGEAVKRASKPCDYGPILEWFFGDRSGGEHNGTAVLEVSRGGGDFDGEDDAEESYAASGDDVVVGEFVEWFGC